MEIPLNVQVECTDGVCGRSAFVLIDPVADQVTHLVVKEDASNKEYIVPVDLIAKTITDSIRLRCDKAKLEKMHPFIKTKFIEEKVPNSSFGIWWDVWIGIILLFTHVIRKRQYTRPWNRNRSHQGSWL